MPENEKQLKLFTISKVLFAGGRSFTDKELVKKVFDYVKMQIGLFEICHGSAIGLDTLADEVARELKIKCTMYPVPTKDYRLYGNRAPTMRNQRMLDEFKPDLVVIFPGASGTQDMHNRAFKAGKLILNVSSTGEYKWENQPALSELKDVFPEYE